MTTPTLPTLLIAVVAALALGACGRADERTAGQQLDAAVAQSGQKVDAAKVEVQQQTADAKVSLEAGAAKAATAVENAANKVADKTADAMITAGVNAELAKDPGLSALRIDVDTDNGRVKLSGTAPDSAARDRASRLAAGVKGVSSVDNRLDVRG